MKKIFILYGALAILVIVLIIWRTGVLNTDFSIPFTNSTTATAQVNEQEINLITARTEEERIQGLSDRRSLEEDTGMLFIFEEKDEYSFWMKNMNFPIDIIFIDDNTVVNIVKNAEPIAEDAENPPVYSPDRPVNHVLEVNAGVAEQYGITEGSTITFENIE